MISALVAGVFVYLVGIAALASVRAPIVRGSILLMYVVSAAIAGFGIMRDLANLTRPVGAWSSAFGIVGAALTAAAALARLTQTL